MVWSVVERRNRGFVVRAVGRREGRCDGRRPGRGMESSQVADMAIIRSKMGKKMEYRRIDSIKRAG